MRRGPAVRLTLAIGLAVLALIVLLPFWWVMSSSIKATNEIVSSEPTMVPHSFTLEHFEKLLGKSDFPRFLLNSVVVSSASMGITVALAVLSGYAFFRLRFPGRDFLYRAIFFVGLCFSRHRRAGSPLRNDVGGSGSSTTRSPS